MPANGPMVNDEPETATRQCGRCRETFAGDPDTHPTALPDWWACEPCREALFGTRPTA